MLQVLLVIALAVIYVQNKEIKRMKKETKRERIAYRKFVKVLVRTANEYKQEADEYKEAYEDCYAEYRAIFREKKAIQKHLNYVEELHSYMVNNMHTLLKQGRVIKSKYMDKIVPYESFSSLSADDRYELFGA